MDFRLLGSILLILGTSIGAGILALPIATAQFGFFGSLILLFLGWGIMTSAALLLLEVNLWFPKNSNIISMAKSSLGLSGELISWCIYLLLLYSLLCAYISGGSQLLHGALEPYFEHLPTWLPVCVFTAALATVIYFGIRSVDYLNRTLMLIKLGSFFLLSFMLLFAIETSQLSVMDIKQASLSTAITVTITSFGFATIIPSLRVYFDDDVQKLRIAVLLGSFIPLICYILWDMVIMGIIPLHGETGLAAIQNSGDTTQELVSALTDRIPSGNIHFLVKLFTSISVVTSFLGVGLCLVDFLKDGFRIGSSRLEQIFIHIVTFVPALLLVIYKKDLFISALSYAGILCVLLLVLLPVMMTWRGRYHLNLAPQKGYRALGDKFPLISLFLFAITIVVISVINELT